MLPATGTLKIRVTRRDGGVSSRVDAPEPLPVDGLLLGRGAEEAARTMPLIFNICAAAQEAAARSALGLKMDAALSARVAGETLREHVVKLCLVWPPLLGEVAERTAPSLAARALQEPAAAAALTAAIFAPLDDAPESLSMLREWASAGQTAPARTFARIVGEWDIAWGRVDLPVFDPLGLVDWETGKQRGQAVDNGPCCRVVHAPLLNEIAASRGHGMLWRMSARLIEVSALLNGTAHNPIVAPGRVHAARGVMMIDAEAGPSGVTRFSRLSPTEFALVPGGVLARSLATLPSDADAPLRTITQMVVETVDPCIATELEVADA